MTYNTDSDCSQIKIWKVWRYQGSRKSKKDRQHNDKQWPKDKNIRTNNDQRIRTSGQIMT